MSEETLPNVAEMNREELAAHIQALAVNGDIEGIQSATATWHKAAKARAEAEREARTKLLTDATAKVMAAIGKAIDKAIEGLDQGVLEKMDGVWYAKDFGDESASCRLTKSVSTGGGTKRGEGSSTGSYVSVDVKTKELLEKVGADVYFVDETKATIAHEEVTFAAGTTYKEAWDFSTNGGWHNRVRMAMLKAAGLLPTK